MNDPITLLAGPVQREQGSAHRSDYLRSKLTPRSTKVERNPPQSPMRVERVSQPATADDCANFEDFTSGDELSAAAEDCPNAKGVTRLTHNSKAQRSVNLSVALGDD